MIFGVLNPETICYQQLVRCPPHLYTVATLPREIQKAIFNSIIHTYFRLFTLSQKKTNCYPLTHHTWKNVTALPCKMHNFFIWLKVCSLLQTVALKKAGCGLALVALKRTGCDVWQMKCQASNVTANVQTDHLLHVYMLPVFFAADQLHRPQRSAEIQPCRNKTPATHPYRGLLLDTYIKEKRKICAIYKVVRWHLKKVDVFGTQCINNKT